MLDVVVGVPPGASASLRLVKSLWARVVDADLSINASAVAYNAFLALVPLAVAALGAASLVGRDEEALSSITSSLEVVAPPTVVVFVADLLREAGDQVGGGEGWLIAGSVLVALLLGSRAVAALQKALAAVENRTEARRGVVLRLVAVGLTVAAGATLVLTSLLLVMGRRSIEFLSEWSGAGWLGWVWEWLRIPVAALGLFLFLLAFYRWGPPNPLPRAWLAALVGALGTILASLGFGWYLTASPNLGATFGVLGAVAVALVWLYLGSMAILLGAVVVAYLERNHDAVRALHPVGALRSGVAERGGER
jgi:membrane protein